MRKNTNGLTKSEKVHLWLDPANEWVEEVDGCLLWLSALDSGGYSKTSHQVDNVRQYVSAHILVCEEFHGEKLNESDMVEHLCEKNGDRNHRRCINPDHLRWGSYRDNNREWKTRNELHSLRKNVNDSNNDYTYLFESAQQIIWSAMFKLGASEQDIDDVLTELIEVFMEGTYRADELNAEMQKLLDEVEQDPILGQFTTMWDIKHEAKMNLRTKNIAMSNNQI